MRRLTRIVLATVVLLVVAASAAVAWVLWHPDSLRPVLARVLSAQLDRPVTIEGPLRLEPGWVTAVEVEGLRVAAPAWARSDDLASVVRLRVAADVWAYLRHGTIRIAELALARPHLALERDVQGRTSWPQGSGDGGGELPAITLGRVEIGDGRIDLRDAPGAVDVTARFASAKAEGDAVGLRLDGSGTVRGEPLKLLLQVAAERASGGIGAVTVDGSLDLAAGRLALTGGIDDPLALEGIDLRLDLTSPDPSGLLALAGLTIQNAPPLEAQAHLTGGGRQVGLDLARFRWGETSLGGRLAADLAPDRPRLDGRLEAELIDVAQLLHVVSSGGPADDPPTPAPLGNPLRPLAAYRGKLELTATAIRLPSGTELRDAAVTLDLDENGLRAPLRVALPEGAIEGELATGPLDGPELAVDTRLTARAVAIAPLVGQGYGGKLDGELAGNLLAADLPTLLARSRLRFEGRGEALAVPQAELGTIAATAVLEDGRVTLDSLRADLPEGQIAGRVVAGPFGPDFAAEIELDATDVDLAAAARSDAVGGRFSGRISGVLRGAEPLDLLTRSRIELAGTVADLRLPQLERRIDQAEITASLDPDRREALVARVDAVAGDRPLALSLFGGSVATLAQNRGDYPFTLRSDLGRNEVDVNGTVTLPLTERRFAATIAAQGQDPSPILALFELPRLQVPPYRLEGAVSNRGDEVRISSFDGRVGDSDLAADLVVTLAGERPSIAGTLRSRVLDADDLGGLVGVTPGTGPGETASAGQEQEAARLEQRAEVLPDEPIDPERWRRIDLDLDLRADEIRAGALPLDGFTGRITMTDGLLRVEEIDLAIGEGHLTGRIEADGRRSPVRGDVDLTLRRVSVARLLNRLDVDVAAFGTLSGQAQGGLGLGGRGRSIADILGSSNGQVRLLMEGGQVDRTIVAAAGFDLLRLLGAATGASPETVEMHCALADLDIRDGVVSTDPMVIDTAIAELGGRGTVDLESETIDVSLTARPKQTPLLTDLTGISIGGRLGEPEIEINPLAVAARGVAAATLGLVLKPFTALAGTESAPEGSGCGRLLAREAAGEPGG
jgi:uncharacterized protein involved in outer membrane biogenesis